MINRKQVSFEVSAGSRNLLKKVSIVCMGGFLFANVLETLVGMVLWNRYNTLSKRVYVFVNG